jgi:nitroreductase
MELIDALRTTGAVRDFTGRTVEDAVLARVLDTARFAPSGANAEAWRVGVVEDAANRRRLRGCSLRGSRDYFALAAAGLRPRAPTSDREAEARALNAENVGAIGDFAKKFDEVPALLALFARASSSPRS